MYLWEILDNAAATVGGRDALISQGRRWTFSELASSVSSFAQHLGERVEPGTRVAVLAENTASYVTALYGVPRAGAVLVHANTRHTPDEIAATFERSGTTLLLGTAEQLGRLEDLDLPSVRDRVELDDLMCQNPARDTVSDNGAAGGSRGGELAWLMYTSGTTGAPKGVMLTHRSLLSAALNTTMARPIAGDEVYLFCFPLFHVAAYNVIHHHLRQRPVVLLAGFEPVAAMRAIQTESVTSVSLAPTMLAMLLDHPDRSKHDISSLRNVSYGAAAMPLELLRRSLRELPEVGLSQGYGMTELSGNAVFLSPAEHRRAASEDPALLTAAGRPAPMTALRTVDESGTDTAAGEPGEILVRGDQLCAGYFEDEDSTEAAFTDGWLHTGDVGRIDERGYLHVVDRLKDIIITGGENVSSREVEDALSVHPSIRSVAVIGTPDDRWGELVTAVVVPTHPDTPPSVEELRTACAHLAGFKHPRKVVATDELPTNASGKVDKTVLRSLARREVEG